MDTQSLRDACERIWAGVRRTAGGEGPAGFHPDFHLRGFPGPAAGSRFARRHEEAPDDNGDLTGPEEEPVPSPQAGIEYLQRFFGEGKGLTNLVHFLDGVQVLDEIGVAQTRWVAEYGLGEKGSPRYVSGRVSLTFLRDGNEWKLRGWLGTRGPHHAVEGSQRAEDVLAIREQILRVFEAYRQKDVPMLRRTHTADWRGFTLASPSVGRGIDAYIQAAEGAIGSTQFEEYQILELAPVFYGDLAIVPYVARIAGKNRQGRTEAYRLRVLDVYLREPMGWNQIAANTSLHPEELIGG